MRRTLLMFATAVLVGGLAAAPALGRTTRPRA